MRTLRRAGGARLQSGRWRGCWGCGSGDVGGGEVGGGGGGGGRLTGVLGNHLHLISESLAVHSVSHCSQRHGEAAAGVPQRSWSQLRTGGAGCPGTVDRTRGSSRKRLRARIQARCQAHLVRAAPSFLHAARCAFCLVIALLTSCECHLRRACILGAAGSRGLPPPPPGWCVQPASLHVAEHHTSLQERHGASYGEGDRQAAERGCLFRMGRRCCGGRRQAQAGKQRCATPAGVGAVLQRRRRQGCRWQRQWVDCAGVFLISTCIMNNHMHPDPCPVEMLTNPS